MESVVIDNDITKMIINTDELKRIVTSSDFLHSKLNLNDDYYKERPDIREVLSKYEKGGFDYRFHHIGENTFALYMAHRNYKGKPSNDDVMTQDALQYKDIIVTMF